MKTMLTLLLVAVSYCCVAQKDLDAEARAIVAEGRRLYKSEMASWHGTDLFAELYRDKEKVGGYLSYAADDQATCIFYNKAETPKVLWTITFDSTFDVKTANIDIAERPLTAAELELYTIRTAALLQMQSDTLFKIYENTSFNLIPLVSNGQKKVYVLTGPKDHGVVVFGNDYLLTFDADNKLQNKKRLHKNIIPVPFGDEAGAGEDARSTLHVHLPETGAFITATDVCTLLLYEKFAGWDEHTVVSKEYLNFWNCKTDELHIIPTDTIRAINKDQGHPKKKKR